MRETIFGKNYELEENPDEQDKPSNSPKVITLNFKNKKNQNQLYDSFFIRKFDIIKKE